jgi:hypothetical protein
MGRLTPGPGWKEPVAGILPDSTLAGGPAKTFSGSWKWLKGREIEGALHQGFTAASVLGAHQYG